MFEARYLFFDLLHICNWSTLNKSTKNIKHHLYHDEIQKEGFTPTPIVSYHSARKISSYLERAKLYPLERLNI